MMNYFILGTAALLIISERIPRLRFRASPLLRTNFISDIFYLLTGFVAGGSFVIAYITFSSEWIGTNVGLPRLASIDLPIWLSVSLALIAIDLGNYTAHYLLHRFDQLWEFHKVHHSSPTLDWLATFRSHLIEQIFRRLLAPSLLVLVGFPLEPVVVAGGLFTAWGMFNHSNLRLDLRFLEPIMITPRLHRIHHLPEMSGKNLGTMLTLWDRLRGTFILAETEKGSVFGNGDPSYPQGWGRQFVEPLLRTTAKRMKKNEEHEIFY
jgi:sterol desaturase/sphingolipid hydroxylase (fatty acid hydroxylase superfamily)